MSEAAKKEERSIELRSEKVRSIVGQIPPVLMRYGVMVIGLVISILFLIAYFLPYKQVYTGIATIHQLESPRTNNSPDSTTTTILLRFDSKRLSGANQQTIHLQAKQGVIKGKLLELSTIRDTLERQEGTCRFRRDELEQIAMQSVDFRIDESTGNILEKLLGDMKF